MPSFLALLSAVALSFSLASAQTFSPQGSKLVGSGAAKNTNTNAFYNGIGINQGTSVALSADGDTALVGAPNDDTGVGAVWVFVRGGADGAWSQQGNKLVASDASGNANFGQSVALSSDGNTALIGGPADNSKAGAAWIFTRASDGTWSQLGSKLVGTGASAAPATTGQGWSVSLSAAGTTAIVSGEAAGGAAPVAWIFTASSGAWTQQGNRLLGTGYAGSSESSTAYPGSAVAISGDGNTAAVSAPWDTNGVGAIWIFIRTGSAWTQQGAKLASTETVAGNEVSQLQGASVALSSDGNTLLAAAAGSSDALVFIRDSSGNWSQQGNALVVTGSLAGSLIQSVALSGDGNTALLGAPGGNTGGACAFTRDSNGNWTQYGNNLIGPGSVSTNLQGVGEGSSVALSSDASTALIGGPLDHNLLGAAWPFVNAQSTFSWVPGSLTQVAIGADGSVWGINEFEQIYTWNFTTSSWNNIPGSLVQIAVGSNTSVWGVNAQNNIYHWDSTNSKWDQIPGSLVQIAVGADGDVWGINGQSSVYHYNPQGPYFEQVTGSLKQITVGSAGAVYGLGQDGGIYWYNPGLTASEWFSQPTGAFVLVANTNNGGFAQISAGSDGDLWAVKGEVAYHYDVLHNSMGASPGSIAQVAVGFGAAVFGLNASQQIYQWNAASATWVEIPGELKQIAVGANGLVWGINSAQQIYRFGGPTRQLQSFSQIPGTLNHVYVGADGSVWALAGNPYNAYPQTFQVQYFNAGTQTFENVSGAPSLVQLAVGAGADVWGLDASNNIYQYDATTGSWNTIPGTVTFIQVGADGSVWGLNNSGQIYNYNFSNASWTNIPGQLSTLSVGADGSVWGLNNQSEIFRYDQTTQKFVYVQGSLNQIAVGSANNVWGVNQYANVYRFDTTTQSWVIIPDASLGPISVGFDGTVWGMDNESNLYEYNPATERFDYEGTVVNFGIEIPYPVATSLSVGNSVSVWSAVIGNYGGPSVVYSWF